MHVYHKVSTSDRLFGQKPFKVRNAFSLVELSIVLVILGLLVGGVLSGQSLIKAAELRTIPRDYAKYTAAFNSFRDKYFALPGDMPNATQFWGSLGGTGADADCQSITATDKTTCSGNGDGSMLDFNSSAALNSYEVARVWQHLANAGLIEGSYDGAQTLTPVIGTTVPRSGIANGYFILRTSWNYSTAALPTYYAGDPNIFAGEYGKDMFMFKSNGNSATSGILAPEDAWNTDTKMDDGNPMTGSIIASKGAGGAGTQCTTVAGLVPPTDAGGTYLLTNANKDCYLVFPRVF